MLNSGLYIVATPIGNLGDISVRALETLSACDTVACEDTRVAKKLFRLLNLPLNKNFICCQDHNEEDVAQLLTGLITDGKNVALISDAGSPLISDPGYKLVCRCRRLGLPVFALPGASAVITALQLSGLPTNRFMFAGFIPNKDKARLDLFNELKNINTTLVFYETSLRLVKTLQAAANVFGNRQTAVVREITKIFEECRGGTPDELAQHYQANPPKGEIVLIVEPPHGDESTVDIAVELQKRLSRMSLKSAVREVADLSGRSKNEVYQLALELQNEQKSTR